jgi:hypothetical protein
VLFPEPVARNGNGDTRFYANKIIMKFDTTKKVTMLEQTPQQMKEQSHP